MQSVTVRIRDNGPLVIEGPVEIVDSEGGRFQVSPDKPAVALCRCGASGNKPFCDGSHRACGFESVDRAPSE